MNERDDDEDINGLDHTIFNNIKIVSKFMCI